VFSELSPDGDKRFADGEVIPPAGSDKCFADGEVIPPGMRGGSFAVEGRFDDEVSDGLR